MATDTRGRRISESLQEYEIRLAKIRRTVTQPVVGGDESLSSFEMSLGEIRDMIDASIASYGEDARYRLETYPYSDGQQYYALMRDRLETDEEYAARIGREEVDKRSRIETLQRELAKLQGDNT
jgi:hypothetical protein